MFDTLIRLGGGRILDVLAQLIKGRLIEAGIKVAEGARGMFFASLVAMLCLLLISTGFLLLHVALFLVLPWSIADRALLLLILSAFYMLVPIVLIIWLNSRQRWLKLCGAKEMIDQLSLK